MSAHLPDGFVSLEPFAAHWAGENAAARAHLRDRASPDEIQTFYDATQPLVEQGLTYLDTKSFADHDEKDRRLMLLLLSFAHVAMAVEVQKDQETIHTRLRGHMRILRAPADA